MPSLTTPAVPCRALSVGGSRARTTALRTCIGIAAVPAFLGVVIGLLRLVPSALVYALPLAFFLGVSHWLRRRASLGAGSVVVEGGALRLDGASRTESFPLSEIAWGARAERDGTLDFEMRDGRRAHVAPERIEDVEALLTATGTSVDQRAIRLPLRGVIGPFVSGVLWFFAWTSALMGLAAALPASAFAGIFSTLGVPVLSFALAWTLVRLRRPELSVGVDGIRYKLGFRERFVPYGDEASIEAVYASGAAGAAPYVTALRIVTRAGEVIDLPIVGWSESDIDRVLVRVREAQASHGVGRDGAPADAFARRDRTLPAWRADLLRSLSSEGDFRHRRISADDAEGVLADPKAPLETRVGAAIALRALDGASAQPRIRIAASASVDPLAARALLATLAEEEDAAIDEALAAVTARRSS